METKRVFVTGATGFIGRYFVKELVFRGHHTTCLIRNPRKKTDLARIGSRLVVDDLMNVEKLKKHLKGQDAVFHLAAIRGERNIPWEEYYKVNVEATRKLLETAAETGVSKFIYVSSVGVHGTSPVQVPADEDTPCNPDSNYHKSKMLAEQVVLEKANFLNTVIIRPTITYGPYDTGFLYRIARNVKRGFFPLVGPGDNKVHILYVKGLVEALIKAMELKSIEQVYIVADRNPIELRNLVRLVASSMMKKLRFIRLPFKPFMEFSKAYDVLITPLVNGLSMEISFKLLALPWHYSIAKAEKQMGYKPYQTEEMVKNTIAWYIKQGWL